ncbi:hypothetical protein CPB85DRAFT_1475400 [Mucidula mucida]|nr:hypothetical protein CPB85DRAFT_1475400 [Mucidula mucida]
MRLPGRCSLMPLFDGQRLPDSQLADPTIQTSALIDTGNSLIRGPADVIDAIYTQIGGTSLFVLRHTTNVRNRWQDVPCRSPRFH